MVRCTEMFGDIRCDQPARHKGAHEFSLGDDHPLMELAMEQPWRQCGTTFGQCLAFQTDELAHERCHCCLTCERLDNETHGAA